jgi:hypothetical protein
MYMFPLAACTVTGCGAGVADGARMALIDGAGNDMSSMAVAEGAACNVGVALGLSGVAARLCVAPQADMDIASPASRNPIRTPDAPLLIP